MLTRRMFSKLLGGYLAVLGAGIGIASVPRESAYLTGRYYTTNFGQYFEVRGNPERIMEFYEVWQQCIWPGYEIDPQGIDSVERARVWAEKYHTLGFMADNNVYRDGVMVANFSEAIEIAIEQTKCLVEKPTAR